MDHEVHDETQEALPSDAPAPDPADERLARLERSVAQLRLVAGASAALAAAALGFAALHGAPDALRVRELAVIDGDGRTRIALTAADGKAELALLDAAGHVRVSQASDSEGKAGWTLFDPQGERRLGAVAFADGDAGLALIDPGGVVRIQLLSQQGTASTLHLDAKGRKRIETSAGNAGDALTKFMDVGGAVTLAVGTKADGEVLFATPKGGEPEPEDVAATQ